MKLVDKNFVGDFKNARIYHGNSMSTNTLTINPVTLLPSNYDSLHSLDFHTFTGHSYYEFVQ